MLNASVNNLEGTRVGSIQRYWYSNFRPFFKAYGPIAPRVAFYKSILLKIVNLKQRASTMWPARVPDHRLISGSENLGIKILGI